MKTRETNNNYDNIITAGFTIDVTAAKKGNAVLHLIRDQKRTGKSVTFKGNNQPNSRHLAMAPKIRHHTHLGYALMDLWNIASTFAPIGREGFLNDTKPTMFEQVGKSLMNNDSASHAEQQAASNATFQKHYGDKSNG